MIKLSEFPNSKKQGDAGLGVAISWFVLNGNTVCIPLTDSQDYDLVIEENSILKKVQVKTAYSKEKKSSFQPYKVGLRTRTTINGKNIHVGFDNTKVDYVFILTLDNEKYLIPSDIIVNKTVIVLSGKYLSYKVL